MLIIVPQTQTVYIFEESTVIIMDIKFETCMVVVDLITQMHDLGKGLALVVPITSPATTTFVLSGPSALALLGGA